MGKFYFGRSTRRSFMLGLPLAGCAATTARVSSASSGDASLSAGKAAPEEVARLSSLEGEALWQAVRAQYDQSSGIGHFNAANMTPPCNAARQALNAATADIDADPSFENRGKYAARHELTRERLAALINAAPEEIALTRNTSEGNNLIVRGLALSKGDEVVLWGNNHRSNKLSWQVRAERDGFTIKDVKTPASPESDEDMIAPFRAAITDRTQLVSFSHVANNTGAKLPAAKICKLAADAGALSLIDGAQTVGSLAVDVKALGCDFLTTSGQKWLTGVREAGMAFIRADRQSLLSPLIVSYPLARSDVGARAFEQLGQRDDGAVAALGEAAALHLAIGPKRVEARVAAFTTLLVDEIKARNERAQFVTPSEPGYRHGVVITKLSKGESRAAQADAYQNYRISGAPYPGAFRLCPHIFHTQADIARAASAVAAWA
ncbi:MAG: aminotransferase class V-fold PLP-dependent enzyme [Pseudomonadota bacterium]